MPVQVFRVLIPAEVSQHTTGAVFCQDFLRYFTNNTKHLEQERTISIFERDQRRDVTFRNDHNMHGPKRARVVICEHVIRFANDFYWCAPAQYFVAVEVFSH